MQAKSPGRNFIATEIGVMTTAYRRKSEAPRQPNLAEIPSEGIITLHEGSNFEQALRDLQGFEFIWVIFWFDQSTNWRPTVLPPRGGLTRRGVFATRSPHRPNPIGLSLLQLLEIRGRTLRVASPDLLDGTPILDIKPYLPSVEAHPTARQGWLGGMDAELRAEPLFSVRWSLLAQEQRDFLQQEFGIDLSAAAGLLQRTPHPHPYRRIKQISENRYELALQSWRARFCWQGRDIVIEEIVSGYLPEALADPSRAGTLHQESAHREFHQRWGAGAE